MTLTVPATRLYQHRYESPVGTLYIAVNRAGSLVRLAYHPITWPEEVRVEENAYACGEVELQLDEYFRGDRTRFSIDVVMAGTEFYRSVWARLLKLSYGSTMSYGELAKKVGREGAARAVGNAVAMNPAVIVVPCHRVVPAGGGLGNYAKRNFAEEEGKRIKRLLLEMESRER